MKKINLILLVLLVFMTVTASRACADPEVEIYLPKDSNSGVFKAVYHVNIENAKTETGVLDLSTFCKQGKIKEVVKVVDPLTMVEYNYETKGNCVLFFPLKTGKDNKLEVTVKLKSRKNLYTDSSGKMHFNFFTSKPLLIGLPRGWTGLDCNVKHSYTVAQGYMYFVLKRSNKPRWVKVTAKKMD